jgi:hypothetical protein
MTHKLIKPLCQWDIKDVEHTLAIGNKSFVDWFSFAYYTSTKRGNLPGKSASESAIKQACFALSGIAKHDGKSEQVYLRSAGSQRRSLYFHWG